MIGIINGGQNEIVDHSVSSLGAYWEFNTDEWQLSTNPLGEGSTITAIGNSDSSDIRSWDGWNFFWLTTTSGNQPWALGFYKFYNSKNNLYFYLDCRVDEFGEAEGEYSPPGFGILLNADTSEKSYYYKRPGISADWTSIGNGSVIRIWEIFNTNPPETNSLENFWRNALVLITDTSGYAKLVWGPHQSFNTTNFYIYRAVSSLPVNPKNLTYSLIAIRNSSTLEFTDIEFQVGGNENYAAFYYVMAYNSNNQTFSGKTNIVSTEGEYYPNKINEEKITLTTPIDFELEQNYPNPFNPRTVIRYTVGKRQYANLKVYDVLGNEIVTLVDGVKEAGTYEIEFNADNLPSGIYLYRLTAGCFTDVKKWY